MKRIKVKPVFDIFSPSKKSQKIKKKISKQKIIVDHREKNSHVVHELESNGFVPEFHQLKVADYIINETAIERKTVQDFVSSMINKRLIKQLKELRQYPSRLLIIEGIDEQELYLKESEYLEEKTQRIHPNAIRGFLLSILLNYEIPMIFTKNAEDTVKFISILSKKKKRELPLNVNKKNLNKKERIQFILESFHGIGPKTARKLLKKFKTLKNIFSATEEQLEEAIGKKGKDMFKIIHTNYSESGKDSKK